MCCRTRSCSFLRVVGYLFHNSSVMSPLDIKEGSSNQNYFVVYMNPNDKIGIEWRVQLFDTAVAKLICHIHSSLFWSKLFQRIYPSFTHLALVLLELYSLLFSEEYHFWFNYSFLKHHLGGLVAIPNSTFYMLFMLVFMFKFMLNLQTYLNILRCDDVHISVNGYGQKPYILKCPDPLLLVATL